MARKKRAHPRSAAAASKAKFVKSWDFSFIAPDADLTVKIGTATVKVHRWLATAAKTIKDSIEQDRNCTKICLPADIGDFEVRKD